MPDDDETAKTPLFDGRYRLLGKLGSGGMATVYLAEDGTLGRNVAIKILAERYVSDEGFAERFRREAQAAARLNHPNIVAIYDRGEAEGTSYIAMEYLDGQTLKDVIRERGPMPPADAIDDALQILSAVGFAHQHGVVHRDIKPQNVMCASDGRLKVTDFGIARAGASQMTEVGSIIGTAQYLSPEQARGQQVGPQSDLYSVGIVLYEMLTGQVPFDGDSAVAIAMKQVSDQPLPPSRIVPTIPPPIEQVVLRALAKDPTLRYQTAADMAADLERVRRGVAPSALTQQFTTPMPAVEGTRVWTGPPADRVPPEPPPKKRSLWPWLLAALLLLLTGGFLAYALGAFDDSPESTTTSTSTTGPVVIPQVVGLPFDEAQSALVAEGFKVAPPQRVRSTAPKDQVIEATPQQGTEVAAGSTIRLKVSKGTRPVPGVEGQTAEEATATLRGAGFVVRQTEREDSAEAGTVIDQNPAQGDPYPIGATVSIVVSKLPSEVKVPDLFQMSQEQAVNELRKAGLNPGEITRESSETIPVGLVTGQDPSSGTTVARGSAVDLIVSDGTPKVTVPSVVGLTIDDAIAQVQDAGLVPQESSIPVTDPAQVGIVTLQSPNGGVRVEPGTKVILRYGELPPEDFPTETDG